MAGTQARIELELKTIAQVTRRDWGWGWGCDWCGGVEFQRDFEVLMLKRGYFAVEMVIILCQCVMSAF